jgi:hypothetical protein
LDDIEKPLSLSRLQQMLMLRWLLSATTARCGQAVRIAA